MCKCDVRLTNCCCCCVGIIPGANLVACINLLWALAVLVTQIVRVSLDESDDFAFAFFFRVHPGYYVLYPILIVAQILLLVGLNCKPAGCCILVWYFITGN